MNKDTDKNMTKDLQDKGVRGNKRYSKRVVNNLVAVVILLVGALVGSLLVDVVQIAQKSGFSDKAISSTDVVRHDGRTWVAYRDEIVPVVMITDTVENCANCQDDELVTWLRYVVPTIQVERVMMGSQRAGEMISQYNIKQIPAILFGDDVTTTPFFAQAAPFFVQRDDRYYLQTARMGVSVGKWIASPTRDNGVLIGKSDASKIVTVWGGFDCVGCAKVYKAAHEAVAKDDSLSFVWKYRPDVPNDARGERAAMAAYCADEQDKFAQYSDTLSARASSWRARKTDEVFVGYTRRVRGMDIAQFRTCLAENKFKDSIVRDLTEADDFGIAITPMVMVSDGDNIQMSKPPTTAVQLREMLGTK